MLGIRSSSCSFVRFATLWSQSDSQSAYKPSDAHGEHHVSAEVIAESVALACDLRGSTRAFALDLNKTDRQTIHDVEGCDSAKGCPLSQTKTAYTMIQYVDRPTRRIIAHAAIGFIRTLRYSSTRDRRYSVCYRRCSSATRLALIRLPRVIPYQKPAQAQEAPMKQSSSDFHQRSTMPAAQPEFSNPTVLLVQPRVIFAKKQKHNHNADTNEKLALEASEHAHRNYSSQSSPGVTKTVSTS